MNINKIMTYLYRWNIRGGLKAWVTDYAACEYSTLCYELGRLANQGSNFSWTISGLSSWGQCPTPSSMKSLTFSCWEGNAEKNLPTGPSMGVKGSWSPHKSKTGKEILGINCTGLGPGGPVTMDTNASKAPGSSAGPLMIYICRIKMQILRACLKILQGKINSKEKLLLVASDYHYWFWEKRNWSKQAISKHYLSKGV